MRLWLLGVFFFLYAPLVALIAFSFNDSKRNTVWRGFTLDYYQKLFNDQALLIAFANSLTIALMATLISLVIGALAAVSAVALSLPRQDGRGGRLHPADRRAGNLHGRLHAAVLHSRHALAQQSHLAVQSRLDHHRPRIVLLPLRRARRRRAAGELQQGAGGGGARSRRQRLAGVPRRAPAAYAPGADRRRACSPSRCRSTTS